MNLKASFIAMALGLGMTSVQANTNFSQQELEDHFTITSAEVTEVELPEYMQTENYVAERMAFDDGGVNFPMGEAANIGLGDLIMTLENLLAFGKKVMDVIKEGRPVVSTNLADPISVIPQVDGTDKIGAAMYDMAGWSFPKAKGFKIALKNKSGKAPIVFQYTIYYQYGGTYEDKGKYLTGVNVVASNVYVGWGYDFKASSKLVAISNHGTRENPLAGATLQIEYTASNVFKSVTKSEIVHVVGDGNLERTSIDVAELDFL